MTRVAKWLPSRSWRCHEHQLANVTSLIVKLSRAPACERCKPAARKGVMNMSLQSPRDKSQPFLQSTVGCTGSTNCPIYLMQSYLDSCHHNTKCIPLFHFVSGKFLTRRTFSNILYECLIAAGVHPKRYSTHSLRIGGATVAALARVHPSLIKDLGQWRSECYCRYTRAPNALLRTVTKQMAQSN